MYRKKPSKQSGGKNSISLAEKETSKKTKTRSYEDPRGGRLIIPIKEKIRNPNWMNITSLKGKKVRGGRKLLWRDVLFWLGADGENSARERGEQGISGKTLG